MGRPWATDRTGVSVEHAVIRPEFATRPAVGEHVICVMAKRNGIRKLFLVPFFKIRTIIKS